MNKIIISIVLLIVVAVPQDTSNVDITWQKELVGSFSFSQAYFNNWASGGEDSLAYPLDLGEKRWFMVALNIIG